MHLLYGGVWVLKLLREILPLVVLLSLLAHDVSPFGVAGLAGKLFSPLKGVLDLGSEKSYGCLAEVGGELLREEGKAFSIKGEGRVKVAGQLLLEEVAVGKALNGLAIVLLISVSVTLGMALVIYYWTIIALLLSCIDVYVMAFGDSTGVCCIFQESHIFLVTLSVASVGGLQFLGVLRTKRRAWVLRVVWVLSGRSGGTPMWLW